MAISVLTEIRYPFHRLENRPLELLENFVTRLDRNGFVFHQITELSILPLDPCCLQEKDFSTIQLSMVIIFFFSAFDSVRLVLRFKGEGCLCDDCRP